MPHATLILVWQDVLATVQLARICIPGGDKSGWETRPLHRGAWGPRSLWPTCRFRVNSGNVPPFCVMNRTCWPTQSIAIRVFPALQPNERKSTDWPCFWSGRGFLHSTRASYSLLGHDTDYALIRCFTFRSRLSRPLASLHFRRSESKALRNSGTSRNFFR